MTSFWNGLSKPFFALAPLADVTDAAFRRIIAKYGKPDVMFTEFTSADGLFLGGEKARAVLMKDLIFTEAERPIVAQFFTANPERMEKAAALAREFSFDGVDINMGCPDRSVEKQGAGAALIKNKACALELIAAAKEGAAQSVSGRRNELPVSIKTRLGYNKNELEEWLLALLSAKPAAITLHARTRKEMSKVPAHWDQIKRAVEIRDSAGSETLIIGNGDVLDIHDAKQKAEESGADGIMLGKAVFGNPWLFLSRPGPGLNKKSWKPSMKEKLTVLVEHTKFFEQLLGDMKNFAVMKKHYKAYVRGFDGARELRTELMEANTADEVEALVHSFTKEKISKK